MRFRKPIVMILAFILIFGASAALIPSAGAEDYRWTGSWGTPAIESGVSLGSDSSIARSGVRLRDIIPANSTVRTIVQVTCGGAQLRLKFSNVFGTKAITINEVTVARWVEDANINADSVTQVTFNGGKTDVTIPAGEELYSDPVMFATSNLEKIAISCYYKRATPIYVEGLYGGTTYLTNSLGNKTHSEKMGIATTGLVFIANTITYYIIPFLSRVDTYTPGGRCVVLIGDSTITNDAYLLFEQKLMNVGVNNVGFIMSGIIGNRVLYDGTGLLGTVYGKSLLSRFGRDALDIPGVSNIIVKIGLNDILHPQARTMKAPYASEEEIENGYITVSEAAKAAGVDISLCELSPYKGYERNFLGVTDYEWNQECHQMILNINEWMRVWGLNYYNRIINLDRLIHPDDPTKIQNQLTIDGAHLSKAGQAAFVDLVPEEAVGIAGDIPDIADILGIDPYDMTGFEDTDSAASNGGSGNSGGNGGSGNSSGGSGFWESIRSAINTFIPGTSSGLSSADGVIDSARRTIEGFVAPDTADSGQSDDADLNLPTVQSEIATFAVITPIESIEGTTQVQGALEAQQNNANVLVAGDNGLGSVNSDPVGTSLSKGQLIGLSILSLCVVAIIFVSVFFLIKSNPHGPALTRSTYGTGRKYRKSDRGV